MLTSHKGIYVLQNTHIGRTAVWKIMKKAKPGRLEGISEKRVKKVIIKNMISFS